jgi:ketosteroid isomerase-like protein
MTDIETNEALVRRYVERFNAGDTAGLLELFTPDATVQGVLGSAPITVAAGVWRELHEAYACELEILELCSDGDKVAARYRERGRSRGSFRGEPVTGEPYQIDAMEWFHIRDGRIAARWGARDNLTIRRQMKLPLG